MDVEGEPKRRSGRLATKKVMNYNEDNAYVFHSELQIAEDNSGLQIAEDNSGDSNSSNPPRSGKDEDFTPNLLPEPIAARRSRRQRKPRTFYQNEQATELIQRQIDNARNRKRRSLGAEKEDDMGESGEDDDEDDDDDYEEHSGDVEEAERDAREDQMAPGQEMQEQEAEEEDDEEVDLDASGLRRSTRLKGRARVKYFSDTENGFNTRRRSSKRKRSQLITSDGEFELAEEDIKVRRSRRQRRNVQRYQPTFFRSTPDNTGPTRDDASYFSWPDDRKRHKKRRRKRKHVAYNDSSSSSASSSDDAFERRKSRRRARDREKIKPINLQDLGLYDERAAPEIASRKKAKSADITPLKIDMNVDWSVVGGLKGHVDKLKEMVVLPLLYPQEFAKFRIQPPRGVIFHGPPGTGKTLVARVLAAEASKLDKKVAFYMRKGADCLSKWVGEAERQLRLLFSEAYKNQPAIIFFDEIDGLAPVRSSRQDQIHSSIVSTLLALMDGLDSRGQIVIIGATNRIDSIDPALRRPGRFDRELVFNLPSRNARKQIFNIHTLNWIPKPAEVDLEALATRTAGYCGADIEGLCREAFLNCFRRTYPQVYDSSKKIQINQDRLVVCMVDFDAAFHDVVPSSRRSNVVHARPLESYVEPLLRRQFADILKLQKSMFPLTLTTVSQRVNKERAQETGFLKNNVRPISPRILLHGNAGMGQSMIGPALLHSLEEFPCFSIDLPTLAGDASTRSHDECLFNVIKEARRNSPSVLYWPRINSWWNSLPMVTTNNVIELLTDLPDDICIYVLATAEVNREDLDPELAKLFSVDNSVEMVFPTTFQIKEFWNGFKMECLRLPQSATLLEPPPEVETVPEENPKEQQSVPQSKSMDPRLSEDLMNFTRLRIFLRSVCSRLNKHFRKFYKPIDVPDAVVQTTIGLREIREMVNESKDAEPMTIKTFLDSIDTLVREVKESTDLEQDAGKEYVNEVCHLQDTALCMIMNADMSLCEACDIAAKSARWQKDSQKEDEENMDEEEEEELEKGNELEEEVENVENDDEDKKEIKQEDDKPEESQTNEEAIVEPSPPDLLAKDDAEMELEDKVVEIEPLRIKAEELDATIDRLITKSVDKDFPTIKRWYFRCSVILHKFSDRTNRLEMTHNLKQEIDTFT